MGIGSTLSIEMEMNGNGAVDRGRTGRFGITRSAERGGKGDCDSKVDRGRSQTCFCNGSDHLPLRLGDTWNLVPLIK